MTSMHLSRRHLLRTAAAGAGAAALAPVLSACGGGSSSASGDGLTYWDWYVSQAPWVDGEIKRFEKARPGVDVTKTTQDEGKYKDLVALANRSGNPPDIFMIPQVPTLAEQVSRKWLLPLDRWATPEWQARFPEGSFVEGVNVFGGKVYSAPLKGQGPRYQLYIHNGVFEDVGLTHPDGSVKLPKTWDDVTRAAQTITKKSGGRTYGIGFGNASGSGMVAPLLDTFVPGAGAPGGAYSMDFRVGKWTYGTDRAYTDFFDLLLEWKKRGYVYPNSMSISDEAARAFFERGKFGMTVGGSYNQTEWTQHHFTDYSMVVLPSPEPTPKAYYYSSTLNDAFAGISPKSRKPEQAWQWFDWLTGPEAGRRYVESLNGVSVYPEANKPEGLSSKPFAAFVASTRYVLPGPLPVVRNADLALVAPAAFTPGISEVCTGIYAGQVKDVKSALSEVADRSHKATSDAVDALKKEGRKVSMADYVFPDWDPTKPYTTKKA